MKGLPHAKNERAPGGFRLYGRSSMRNSCSVCGFRRRCVGMRPCVGAPGSPCPGAVHTKLAGMRSPPASASAAATLSRSSRLAKSWAPPMPATYIEGLRWLQIVMNRSFSLHRTWQLMRTQAEAEEGVRGTQDSQPLLIVAKIKRALGLWDVYNLQGTLGLSPFKEDCHID